MGSAEAKQKEEDQFEQGKKLCANGQFKEAIPHFTEIIELCNKNESKDQSTTSK